MNASDPAVLIQEKWREGFSLLVNGVIRDTNRVTLFETERLEYGKSTVVHVRCVGVTDVAAVLRRNPDAFTAVTDLCESISADRDLRVVGGEGGQGGDGFLAAARISDNHLLWIILSEESNPFVEVALRGDEVVAVTTLDDRWTVPLREPEVISIIAGDPKGWDRLNLRLK